MRCRKKRSSLELRHDHVQWTAGVAYERCWILWLCNPRIRPSVLHVYFSWFRKEAHQDRGRSDITEKKMRDRYFVTQFKSRGILLKTEPETLQHLSAVHFGIIYMCVCVCVCVCVDPVARSVQLLTTGWTVRDGIPVGTRFSAQPDRPWGPPSRL